MGEGPHLKSWTLKGSLKQEKTSTREGFLKILKGFHKSSNKILKNISSLIRL